MSTITVQDGTTIYYKHWGPKNAQPVVFHHGWPLSADDWDAQMMYFVEKGYRVIAHDRRGHGRSSQVSDGHDMDHYAADAAAVVAHLDLRDAVHIGHSTGGGEATRYVARHGKGRVAKLVLIGAVPPIMGDDAVTLRGEVKHLRVPVVRGQRPAVMEDDGLRLLGAPVLEVDLRTVLGSDRVHLFSSLLGLSGGCRQRKPYPGHYCSAADQHIAAHLIADPPHVSPVRGSERPCP